MRRVGEALYNLSSTVVTTPVVLPRATAVKLHSALAAGGFDLFDLAGSDRDVSRRAIHAACEVQRIAEGEARVARSTGADLLPFDRHHYMVSSFKQIPSIKADAEQGCIDGDTCECRKRFYVRQGGQWVLLKGVTFEQHREKHGAFIRCLFGVKG